MATIIKADGSTSNLDNTRLDTLQKAVDGYVELATLPDGRYLLMDEDGKQKKKPINKTATKLLARFNTVVVGDVVVCEPNEMQ